jgi:fatty acid desaturase
MNRHRYYTSRVRHLLPSEAFTRQPARLFYALVHLTIMGVFIVTIRDINEWPFYLCSSLVIGHSLACLAFFSHELSHNSILPRGIPRTFIATIFWAMNLIPTTLWEEVHNQTHHHHTNTVRDPDRRFMPAEKNLGTILYSRTLYPSSETLRWNPLVLVQFIGYIVRNILTAMSGGRWGMLPACPSYTRIQRIRIVLEVTLIVAIQALLLALVKGNISKYVAIGPGAVAVSSAVVMTYVFTNHFLDPIQEESDPLRGTTSVIVPTWMDLLHCHFSFHVEHHLFPAMDSRYSPELSRLLQLHFPDEYKRIPIGKAWEQLWERGIWASSSPEEITRVSKHPQ